MENQLCSESSININANNVVLEWIFRIHIPRLAATLAKHRSSHGFENGPSKFERTFDRLDGMKHVPKRIFPFPQRIPQLTKHTCWNLFTDTVFHWSSVFWHKVRSKQLIPYRKKSRVICPYCISLVCMMPMVEFRSNDEPMQPLQPPSNIGMEEQSKNQLCCSKRTSQFKGKSCCYQKDKCGCKNGPVQWMATESTGPVQMLS